MGFSPQGAIMNNSSSLRGLYVKNKWLVRLLDNLMNGLSVSAIACNLRMAFLRKVQLSRPRI